MHIETILSPQNFPPIYWTFVFSILLVIVDAFTKKESKINANLAIVALIFIMYQAFSSIFIQQNTDETPTYFFSEFSKNMLNFNNLSTTFDIIFCLAGLLVILSTKEYLTKVYQHHKEFYSLIFFAIFGMMCIAHSNNLVVLFLGIETMSITFYVLTGFVRNRESSVEGALKYFLLGAFATGFLLYGMAMIYGATGSMYYDEITASILNLLAMPMYLKLGIGLMVIGLLFKVAAFPFHQWAPDVYQAAATPISGFMSTAGKVAAVAGFIGIAYSVMPTDTLQDSILNLNYNIKLLVGIVAALTMLIGNITALSQKNIKRMLAYSSVGHAGYMLMGVVANSYDGISSIVYYSLAYTFTQIGAFTVIAILEKKDETNLEVTDYAGLAKSHPYLAAMMAMFMFSLAGIPPFAGFFGKYFLFKAAIDAGFTWLTIIAVITSVISVYFYLSVIVQMYFKDREDSLVLEKFTNSRFVVTVAALGILLFGLFPIIDFATNLF